MFTGLRKIVAFMLVFVAGMVLAFLGKLTGDAVAFLLGILAFFITGNVASKWAPPKEPL